MFSDLVNNLKKVRRADLVACASVFTLSMFFCWLLWLVYPQEVTTFETPPFLIQHAGYAWFGTNAIDWIRTIGFQSIVWICTRFGNPSSVLYWFNAINFSIDSALVYVLGRSLFGSVRSALTLAISLLAFEFASMRIFFFNIFVIADPPYAEMTYMGILLSFIGWLRRQRIVFMLGYLILGIGSFIKPVGISLWPVWICFAIFVWLDWRAQGLKYDRAVILSVILFVVPIAFWFVRNYCVYGDAEYSGGGGVSLLKATLPLLADQDILLDNKVANAEFKTAVRQTERSYAGKSFQSLRPNRIRCFWHRQYFFACEPVLGPFDYLAGLRTPNKEERMRVQLDSKRMFALDGQCARVGMRIIEAHPMAYLQRVWGQYSAIFDQSMIPGSDFERFQKNPELVYEVHKKCVHSVNDFFYPGRGSPDFNSSNRALAQAISSLCENTVVRWLLNLYYANQFLLVHLIFVGALLLYGELQIVSVKPIHSREYQVASIVVIFLFLTAVSYNLVLALVEMAIKRLAIGGSDLVLHLMFFLTVMTCALILIRFVAARRYSGLQSDMP